MTITTPIGTLLNWHEGRRTSGIPTVTTLAGPTNLALRTWLKWADPRPVCVVQTARNLDDLAALWAGDLLSACPGLDHVRAWLAEAARQNSRSIVSDIDRMTKYDLECLWRSFSIDPTQPAARAAFLILAAHTDRMSPGPGEIVRHLSEGEQAFRGIELFRGLCAIYPNERWPALLAVPDAVNPSNWFIRVVSFLESIATTVPELPIAITAARTQCEAVVADTHVAAVIREGFVAVEGLTQRALEARLQSAGVAPPPAKATLDRLVADGLAEDVAEVFVEAVRAVRNPNPAESGFRSAAEQFLFEQIQSLPQTTGLFRPNQELPFRHGPQEAEADLLARRLKLVVEVDGGYYHLNQLQYRRDRRKDWLYQQHGYLVLRFLAEDVVDDLETILNTILEAVAFREVQLSLER